MATMNTYDKTSLYEMSYAFMRRFSFIRVEAPKIPDDEGDRQELMQGYLDAWDMEDIQVGDEEVVVTANIWKQVNSADVDREIGPAIAQDMLKFLKESGSDAESNTAAITNYIFPQLEGVPERKKIVKSISNAEVELDDERLSRTAKKMLQVDISGEE
jgi:MoxR-like ATPase